MYSLCTHTHSAHHHFIRFECFFSFTLRFSSIRSLFYIFRAFFATAAVIVAVFYTEWTSFPVYTVYRFILYSILILLYCFFSFCYLLKWCVFIFVHTAFFRFALVSSTLINYIMVRCFLLSFFPPFLVWMDKKN